MRMRIFSFSKVRYSSTLKVNKAKVGKIPYLELLSSRIYVVSLPVYVRVLYLIHHTLSYN